MHGDDVARRVTHDAAADERDDLLLLHGHHGNGGIGRQPIGAVVAAGVVADVVHVAEQEGHRAEALHARTGPACGEDILKYE